MAVLNKNDEDLTFDGPVTARPVTTIEDTDGEPSGLTIVDEGDLVDELALHDFEDEAPTQPGSPLPLNYEYQDWRPEDTQVVTYTTNPALYPKDRTTTSMAAAKAEVETIHGRILETNQVPGRFFFRVMKVKKL